MFHDMVKANRSYRRFWENEQISRETLLQLIDSARIVASGANKQAIKYYLSYEKELNQKIFETVAWAGFFKDWPGPVEGERPAAYLVLVQDETYTLGSPADLGIAAQTILLGAIEQDLGGCMIGNIEKTKLHEVLKMPKNHQILLVIALGKPKETVVIDEMDADGDIKYWRDEKQVHHVPKRKLKDIVMN